LPHPTPHPIGPQQPLAMIAIKAVMKLEKSFIERIMGLSQPSNCPKRHSIFVCVSFTDLQNTLLSVVVSTKLQEPAQMEKSANFTSYCWQVAILGLRKGK
jgi:hypothetical protein